MWYRLNENVWKLEVASVTRTSKIKNYIFEAVFFDLPSIDNMLLSNKNYSDEKN